MIDKSIRQYYDSGMLVKKRADGKRPGYGRWDDPGMSPGTSSGGHQPSGGGGEGGGGGWQPVSPTPAPAPVFQPPQRKPVYTAPDPVVTTAVAPPSILARPPVTGPREAPPGEKGGPGYVSPEDLRKQEIKDLIAQQQEEKYDFPVDPTKFGETISDIDRVMSKDEKDYTIEDKEVIEDWEKDQDWDKVKELADKGYSSDDIQKAMDKGLLMKEDAIRRQGLIEKGLAAIMPKTKLESSLLSTIKKTLDPRKLATNFALKKLGLGWLNPLAGLASLFFPKQIAAVKSKFAEKLASRKKAATKKEIIDYNKKMAASILPQQGERQPDLIKQIAGKGDVISKSIAKYTGKGDDRSSIEGQQAKVAGPALIQMRVLEKKKGMSEVGGPKLTPDEERKLDKLKEMDKEETIYRKAIAAHGGRIDKPLMGRNRYI